MEVRTIQSGGYASATPQQPEAVLAGDAETYARRWSTLIGDAPAPAVDFEKESVVFLLAGSKPTGGWTIKARGASREGDTLLVDAVIDGPPPGGMTTQAFTSPFAVVAVTTTNVKDVRWVR